MKLAVGPLLYYWPRDAVLAFYARIAASPGNSASGGAIYNGGGSLTLLQDTFLNNAVILGDGGPRHVEVTKLVLAAGANPNIADKDGVSPLTHAKRKGQRHVAALIEAAGGR